jgi:hypothetical protein
VRRIDTTAIIAVVTDEHVVGDAAVRQFVRVAVGPEHLTVNLQQAVPVPTDTPFPIPAPIAPFSAIPELGGCHRSLAIIPMVEI